MKFKIKDKAKILLENHRRVDVTVTTNLSKYKGKTYRLTDATWRARVRVDKKRAPRNSIVYYYWDAIKLTNASEAKFKAFKKNIRSPQHDFLGKEIFPNDILFLNGSLYKVEFCTGHFLYLTEHMTDLGEFPRYRNYDVLEGFNTGMFMMAGAEGQYWRAGTQDSSQFFLVDNPLDLLRI